MGIQRPDPNRSFFSWLPRPIARFLSIEQPAEGELPREHPPLRPVDPKLVPQSWNPARELARQAKREELQEEARKRKREDGGEEDDDGEIAEQVLDDDAIDELLDEPVERRWARAGRRWADDGY